MKTDDTLILHVTPPGNTKVYRDIEIGAASSLYVLARAIVSAFDFDFDHAFGFYTGLTGRQLLTKHPMYELFVDIGEADEKRALSVKKTKVAEAFPAIGHTMTFLFDYGDEWLFRVKLIEAGSKIAKVRYPRVVATRGEAPVQYPDPDDEDEEDGPTYMVNLLTGEKIWFKK
ncbi:MAG: hypothetical protein QM576_11375 [Rhodopseudomonas sp.]|uniref:IS1096 element passenger TnpR family protein n=1 Tax=Rhodopseudomonas sp. TaxID=1078 RepID=UPI0039E3B817